MPNSAFQHYNSHELYYWTQKEDFSVHRLIALKKFAELVIFIINSISQLVEWVMAIPLRHQQLSTSSQFILHYQRKQPCRHLLILPVICYLKWKFILSSSEYRLFMLCFYKFSRCGPLFYSTIYLSMYFEFVNNSTRICFGICPVKRWIDTS